MTQIANIPYNWQIRGPTDDFHGNPNAVVSRIRFWNGSPMPFLGNDATILQFSVTSGAPDNRRFVGTPDAILQFNFSNGEPDNHRFVGNNTTVLQFSFSNNK